MVGKKTPWMEYLRKAIWVLLLFILVALTMLTLEKGRVIQMPLGNVDFIISLISVIGTLFLVKLSRELWRLSK